MDEAGLFSIRAEDPRYSPATHIARIPFRNPADTDRFIDGLRKAGLAEE
jgi:adenylate cyclase